MAGISQHRAAWSTAAPHDFPAPVGRRWLSRVDLPEQALWPDRYRSLARIESRAGIEPAPLHFGLVGLSWLVRMRLVSSLAPHAERLLRVSRRFERRGSANGAMHVTVEGPDDDGVRLRRTWSIVAERGDGPRIPVAAAITLAKRIAGVPGYSPLTVRGALPCMGLSSAAEILAELQGYAICTQLREEELTQPGKRSRSAAPGT